MKGPLEERRRMIVIVENQEKIWMALNHGAFRIGRKRSFTLIGMNHYLEMLVHVGSLKDSMGQSWKVEEPFAGRCHHVRHVPHHKLQLLLYVLLFGTP